MSGSPDSRKPVSPMTPRLVVTDAPEPGARQAALGAFRAHVEAAVGYVDLRPLVVRIDDPRSGETVGGLWGNTGWQWLGIELLFVPPALRRAGIGTALVPWAEAEAMERGCRGAWLDTFSFEAYGFYERLGYVRFGTLAEYPRSHQRLFLRKHFSAG
jgi:GNAT superfamily N-acetyltransferase